MGGFPTDFSGRAARAAQKVAFHRGPGTLAVFPRGIIQMAGQTINVYVKSNGLGTAGFVVSLISFFCCGLSAPLGLVMSLVALLWAPRGMAAAGVVLGGLGSWWLFAFGLAMIATLAGASAESQKKMQAQK